MQVDDNLITEVINLPNESQKLNSRLEKVNVAFKELEHEIDETLTKNLQVPKLVKILPSSIQKSLIRSRIKQEALSEKVKLFAKKLNDKLIDLKVLELELNKFQDHLHRVKEELVRRSEIEHKEFYQSLVVKVEVFEKSNLNLCELVSQLINRVNQLALDISLNLAFAIHTYSNIEVARDIANTFEKSIHITNELAKNASIETVKFSEDVKRLHEKQALDIETIETIIENLKKAKEISQEVSEIISDQNETLESYKNQVKEMLLE